MGAELPVVAGVFGPLSARPVRIPCDSNAETGAFQPGAIPKTWGGRSLSVRFGHSRPPPGAPHNRPWRHPATRAARRARRQSAHGNRLERAGQLPRCGTVRTLDVQRARRLPVRRSVAAAPRAPPGLPRNASRCRRPQEPAAQVDAGRLLALVRRRHTELDAAIQARQWFRPGFRTGGATMPRASGGGWVAGFATAMEFFPPADGAGRAGPARAAGAAIAATSMRTTSGTPTICSRRSILEPPADLAEAVEDLVKRRCCWRMSRGRYPPPRGAC